MRSRFFIVFIVFLCLLTGCSAQTSSGSQINVLISADMDISPERISYINQVLKEKGCDYSVKFTCTEASRYDDEYLEEVKSYTAENGDADIIYVGFNAAYNDFCLEYIRSGALLDLTQLLENTDLYEVYDELQWDSVKVDNNIYTIPNEYVSYPQMVIAFNKTYIDENILESYKDTKDVLLHIYDIYKKANADNVYPVLCDYMGSDIAALLNLSDWPYFFVDRETYDVTLPLENEDFVNVLSMLNQMYWNGDLDTSLIGEYKEVEEVDDSLEEDIVDVGERFSSGTFSVYIGYNHELLDNENYYVYKSPIYFEGLFGGTLGIAAGCDKVENALDFLTLLRTDEDVANAVILGEEGRDYQMIDGIACDMERNPMNCYMSESILGTYELVKPCISDYVFDTDKRTYREDLLDTAVMPSDFSGFVPTYSMTENIEDAISFGGDKFVKLCTITHKKNKNIFWDTLNDYKADYTAEVLDYRDEISKQLRSYVGE